jgi:ankyrin repeat protein
LSEEFFKMIKEGQLAQVEQLIERNHDLVNSKDAQGMSPVVVATYYGEPKIAELLVSKGATLNFFEASMIGNLSEVKEAIKKDPSIVNSFSSDGFTALHLAAFFGQAEVMQYLIEKGANVNSVARNVMKVMPLHSAAAQSNVRIVELLLDQGALVNAQQEGGFTALHAAAQSGNLEMARLLLKHGADPNAKTDKGQTPLDITKVEGREAGARKDRERVAVLLQQPR